MIDETFNKLHSQDRLKWTKQDTLFSFSVFVIWRDSTNNKKIRVVVDIRKLNAVFQSNAYSLSLQNDIIQIVQECQFISIIDCVDFFYQWRVHSNDRHKFTVVSHREQKTFKIIVMSNRNSSVYVQKQIDRILKSFEFVRVYVNDIVMFFKIQNEHMKHLRVIFQTLRINNISINLKKTFLSYFSVKLLKQHVTFLSFFTDEFKLQAIANFKFSTILDQFETYFELTKWFRQYIEKYAAIVKFLQMKKTLLLQQTSKSKNARKSYFSKIKFTESFAKIDAFKIIQKSLSTSTYLVYFDSKRQLYIDLDSNKKMKIDDVIYHVIDDSSFINYSIKKFIQSVMFLSRFLSAAEHKYWSTELKLVELVWMLRKIRHLINSTIKFIIIYTNHETIFAIVKQISLSTSSTNRLNLKFVRAFDYIQRFDFIIRHKSERFHLISNALFRLLLADMNNFNQNEEFNVLFTTFLIKMTSSFREELIKEYFMNFAWKRIDKLIEINKKTSIVLSFVKNNELIYRRINHNMSFIFQRLCISKSFVQSILKTVHDFNHLEFDRTYQNVVSCYYIKSLTTHVKRYIKHCFKCVTNQIRRHKSYDSLQSIFFSSISFHIIIIDFVFAISRFYSDMNNIMTITCKFFKRIVIISEINTWNATKWATTLLHRLNISDWDLSKIIIFDRNRKFLFDLWFK